MNTTWRQCTIGDVCDTISNTYNSNAQQVVLINTSDVLEGKVLNHIYIPNENLKGQFKKTFEEGDILYSEIRPQNKRYAYIDFAPINYIASTKLMVIRNKNIVKSKYLYYFLQSDKIISELQMLAETRSGTFPQITFNELSKLSIKIPPLPEQDRIISILDSICKKIDINQQINGNLIVMKQFLLLPILLAAVASVRGASLVEGRIYLKNGSVIECVGDDRLQLPKRFGKLTILRDAFRKTKAKEIFQSGEIDSVVCWHAQSPEHIRKFIPAESPGWMWVYLETPHICVCIYSEKGYGIDSNGGIQVWQRQGTFSQSRTAYYLKKTGEKEFLTVGAANRNTKDVFRERIARYVGDDPELAERIRLSSAIRSKTIQLLRDYDPTKY